MQRRMLSLLAMCCTAVVGIAAAQTPSARFGLGGGATIPVGTYKDSDKIGWHGMGLVQIGVPRSPVDIRVDGVDSHTSHDTTKVGVPSGTTKLYGGLASVVYNVGPKTLMAPADLVGGGGAEHLQEGLGGRLPGEATKVEIGGGGGVSFSLAAVHGVGEAR